MHARVTRVDVQPGKINDAVKTYEAQILPATLQQEGIVSAILLVDRDSNTAISITIWADEEKMALGEVSTYYVEQLKKLAQFFAGMPTRESYEVAVFKTKDT